jgi:hypothetical protein
VGVVAAGKLSKLHLIFCPFVAMISPTIKPYKARASPKIRMSNIPTNSLG